MQKNGAEDWTLGINKDRGMALKFQSKMRLVYIVLGIMSSFILGYLYYSTSMDKIYRHEMSSLTVSVEQLKNQYDEMIETMKDVSYYLLSDPDIMHNFWNFPDVSQQAVSKIQHRKKSWKIIRICSSKVLQRWWAFPISSISAGFSIP